MDSGMQAEGTGLAQSSKGILQHLALFLALIPDPHYTSSQPGSQNAFQSSSPVKSAEFPSKHTYSTVLRFLAFDGGDVCKAPSNLPQPISRSSMLCGPCMGPLRVAVHPHSLPPPKLYCNVCPYSGFAARQPILQLCSPRLKESVSP